MKKVNLYEAKTQLSKLVDCVQDGDRIIIARAGKPVAELSPYQPESKRTPGAWKGKVSMADDFDAPLDDLEQAIYG